jgi:hypothetical protein
MLVGELGEPRRWAIAHQIAVGEFFDAADFVPVSQAHIMADTESLGEGAHDCTAGIDLQPCQPDPGAGRCFRQRRAGRPLRRRRCDAAVPARR